MNTPFKLTGKVVAHGSAKFQFKPDEKQSYYLTLERGQGKQTTVWGIGLANAIAASGVKEGDYVSLTKVDSRPVSVKDKEGQWVPSNRNEWQISQGQAPAAHKATPGSKPKAEEACDESTHVSPEAGEADERQKVMDQYRTAMGKFRAVSQQIRELVEKASQLGVKDAEEMKTSAESLNDDLWEDFRRPLSNGRPMFAEFADRAVSRNELEGELAANLLGMSRNEPQSFGRLSDELKLLSSQVRVLLDKTVSVEEQTGKGQRGAQWQKVKDLAKQQPHLEIVGTMDNWSFNRPPSGAMCGQMNGVSVISGRVVALGLDDKSGLPYVTDEAGRSFLLTPNYGGAWNPVEEFDWMRSGITANKAAIVRGDRPLPNPCPYLPPGSGEEEIDGENEEGCVRV